MAVVTNKKEKKCKNRKRKVIWFNPAFCKLSTINIRRYFLNLIDKQFCRDNPLSKISNRNIVKINSPAFIIVLRLYITIIGNYMINHLWIIRGHIYYFVIVEKRRMPCGWTV